MYIGLVMTGLPDEEGSNAYGYLWLIYAFTTTCSYKMPRQFAGPLLLSLWYMVGCSNLVKSDEGRFWHVVIMLFAGSGSFFVCNM